MRIFEALLIRQLIDKDGIVNEKKLKPILLNVKTGLNQYSNIQRRVHLLNVGTDIDFQNEFSVFYRINPYRDKLWKNIFFKLFELSKKGDRDFGIILKTLQNETGRIEASFVSKLLATLDTTLPVIDSRVLRNLDYYREYIRGRGYRDQNRIDMIIVPLYEKLVADFNQFISSNGGKNIVKYFKAEYPDAKISEVKIVDFILWKM